MSNSFVADAAQYTYMRLLTWRIAALWLVLLIALLAANGGSLPKELPARAALLAVLIALLRLWDDIADRDHDRDAHPQRTLVRTEYLSWYAVVLCTGLLTTGFSFIDDARRLTAYVALMASLGVLYHGRVGHMLPRPARSLLILSKYPIMVFLAGADASARAWFSAVSLYTALGLYEWWDDRELRGAPTRQVLLGFSLSVVVVSIPMIEGGRT